jgi:hypothetical protein
MELHQSDELGGAPERVRDRPALGDGVRGPHLAVDLTDDHRAAGEAGRVELGQAPQLAAIGRDRVTDGDRLLRRG